MSHVKRYWSSLYPLQMAGMQKEQIVAEKAVDMGLTAEDVREMQSIDADCNDCRHFRRGAMRRGLGLTCFEGHCAHFDRPVLAWPMQYSGHPCFEHRRSATD